MPRFSTLYLRRHPCGELGIAAAAAAAAAAHHRQHHHHHGLIRWERNYAPETKHQISLEFAGLLIIAFICWQYMVPYATKFNHLHRAELVKSHGFTCQQVSQMIYGSCCFVICDLWFFFYFLFVLGFVLYGNSVIVYVHSYERCYDLLLNLLHGVLQFIIELFPSASQTWLARQSWEQGWCSDLTCLLFAHSCHTAHITHHTSP